MENVWFLNHGDFTVSQYLPSSKADKTWQCWGENVTFARQIIITM